VAATASSEAPPAACPSVRPTETTVAPLVVLTKRADFVTASRALRQARPGLLVQGRRRASGETGAGVRVGFTCSKKVGNAVARNRAKRRLRAAARAVLPVHGRAGWDYILIGRPEATAARPFESLCADLVGAIAAIHAPRKREGSEG
jgi:ribonuclease P protein component